uniref:Uncharacterized protein n=1 Tax=Oryza meridionalis TaxID=40149 RepID=A0A0E0CN35_9ORYZ
MGGAWWSESWASLPPSQGEAEAKPTRMPRWWLPESVPGTWMGSSQSRQKSARSSTQKMNAAFSWHTSQRGSLAESASSGSRWCFPASLFAACTSTSHAAHSAASSAQHTTAAAALSHASHWIFISSSSTSPTKNTTQEQDKTAAKVWLRSCVLRVGNGKRAAEEGDPEARLGSWRI